MPFKHNNSRRHKFKKDKYRVSNWSEYSDALRKRGDITIWFTEEAIDAWVPDRVPGQKGRPMEYSELAIDEKHQIVASDLTEKSVGDSSALDILLNQVDAFDTFIADGAYDGDPVYAQILKQQPNAEIIIPPPKNAVPNASIQPIRNQHVDTINKQGRMAWQKQTNYGLRALVELAMLRYKNHHRTKTEGS